MSMRRKTSKVDAAPPTPPAEELSIGRLARQTGVSTATIHYYVNEGLLPPARKLSRTRAAYTTGHLRLLSLVRRMQAVGYSLEQVRGAFRQFGTDERGLARMESIGSIQPLPPPKTDADQRPIELFDPIDRAAFVARLGCADALVEELLRRGLLRPREPGRFDARDLWLVRMVLALQKDGVELSELGVLDELLHAAAAAARIALRRIERHRPALRTRALRFSDLVEPFGAAFLYWIDRRLTEDDPDWRSHMVSGPQGRDPAPVTPGGGERRSRPRIRGRRPRRSLRSA